MAVDVSRRMKAPNYKKANKNDNVNLGSESHAKFIYQRLISLNNVYYAT